jgi:NAD+ kinase
MIPAMNTCIRRVGIILKKQDARVGSIVRDIIPWLRARDAEVFLDQNSVDQCPAGTRLAPPQELVSQVDVVSVFGGDGTLLYAARLVGASGIPILGINLGSLGFLTEVKLDEVHEAFEGLLSAATSWKSACFGRGGLAGRKVVSHYLALNDAVINKVLLPASSNSRSASTRSSAPYQGRRFDSLHADGFNSLPWLQEVLFSIRP